MYPLVKTSINLIAIASLLVAANVGWAQSSTLQDIGSKVAADKYPHVTIYKAKEIITLDPVKPKAEAVAVVGNRILATGTLQELKTAIGDQKYSIDETFAGKVIVPGFISQHDRSSQH